METGAKGVGGAGAAFGEPGGNRRHLGKVSVGGGCWGDGAGLSDGHRLGAENLVEVVRGRGGTRGEEGEPKGGDDAKAQGGRAQESAVQRHKSSSSLSCR